jgi:hypothetical protein
MSCMNLDSKSNYNDLVHHSEFQILQMIMHHMKPLAVWQPDKPATVELPLVSCAPKS